MGAFDQHARLAGKLDGAGLFDWMLRRAKSRLAFERWDDARRASWPGGPERTNDLVGILHLPDQPDQLVYGIVEVETEPERKDLKRLGVYCLMLSMEVSEGLSEEEEPGVFGILLTLTGKLGGNKVELKIPDTLKGVFVDPLIIDLAGVDAKATLEEISRGETARGILPWVPLMAGGGALAVVEEWKRQAEQEPDSDRRNAYAWVALVFAELTKELVNWQQALQGWNMRESQLVNEFKREVETEGRVKQVRADLLKFIRGRLANPVPESIRLAIEGTNDLEILETWVEVAIAAPSLTDLVATMKHPS